MTTLSRKRSTLQVFIENEEGANEEFQLTEMKAAVRDRYLDRLGERLTKNSDGEVIAIKKHEGLQADLVAACLTRKTTGTSLSVEELQEWPSSVISELYRAAQELNNLGDRKEKEIKNA